MGGGQPCGTGRARSGSQSARVCGQEHVRSNANAAEHRGQQETEDRYNGLFQDRTGSSPSRMSFSYSMNKKTPARSYIQHSRQESHHAPVDISRSASQGVREDTTELASLALSDIASNRSEHSPTRHHTSSTAGRKSDAYFEGHSKQGGLTHRRSIESSRPDPVAEVSEPSTPHSSHPSQQSRCQSALTEMIKNFPLTEEDNDDTDEEERLGTAAIHPVTVREGIISQPCERTELLTKRTTYGSIKDIESQKTFGEVQSSKPIIALQQVNARLSGVMRVAMSPKSWNKHDLWAYGIRQSASLLPPVILGLLLNILDALSYGMILFPLGDAIFEDLGPDGIAIFYVSCIVSQLTYSLGGSGFKGAIGSEMIEVVPFFHQMAYTIANHVGRGKEDHKDIIRATVIMAYTISTLLTGITFLILGKCKLGSLIGFFPQHILVGCIGGVGWFLVATGLEVSARLPGKLHFDSATLQQLIRADTVALWVVPLALALLLFAVKRRVIHPLTDSIYFLSIIAIFWFFIAAIPELKVLELRAKGWVFEAPEAGVPWYHFYTLFKFRIMNWKAIGATVPAMLALTFFAILHVPINIPALGMQTGDDDLDLDRELTAHGISNILSGVCGSIQNYLVFANTVLFMRSGGDSRAAGVMLAAATFIVMAAAQGILGIIPIMVVGSLIFFLGFELLKEALFGTWGKTNHLEFGTVVIIIVTMGAWDFVYGIGIGILAACVSFVLQTAQISAVRGKLYGGVANSTVRRHPIQHRFLEEAGKQIYVMKLAGFIFFGTIVDVEKQVRTIVDESFQQREPIRYLVVDLYSVDGVDFSASETFARIQRVLNKRDVQLVICGVSSLDGQVSKRLRSAGLFNEDDGIKYFQSLNIALEFCENQLLKPFYREQNSEVESGSSPTLLVPKSEAFNQSSVNIPTDMDVEVPESEQVNALLSPGTMYNSPRMHHLHQVAITTLSEQDPAPPSRWQDHVQPLRLILQTFSTVSKKSDEFWERTVPFLTRKQYAAGTVLYETGEDAGGFYLLESGTLKARYEYPQGKYSELIVAGTTCGELPFFSDTKRTATTSADTDCVTWMLDVHNWEEMQARLPDVASELLKISLKLTAERMDAITKYMLLTSG